MEPTADIAGQRQPGIDIDVSQSPPDRDIRVAIHAIAVHWPQPWPHAVLCANDRASYPCSVRLWADSVVQESRYTESDVMAAATAYRSR